MTERPTSGIVEGSKNCHFATTDGVHNIDTVWVVVKCLQNSPLLLCYGFLWKCWVLLLYYRFRS